MQSMHVLWAFFLTNISKILRLIWPRTGAFWDNCPLECAP